MFTDYFLEAHGNFIFYRPGRSLLNPYQGPSQPAYFATLPPVSPSTTTSTTTSTTAREGHEDEAEEYDYDENGSAFDSDLNADLNSLSGNNGSQLSACQLTRSASEEALSVRFCPRQFIFIYIY